ncbi:MAG: PAS domain S-box protein [Saonia sp.]
MLNETNISFNNYLIKQLPQATAFVDKKLRVVHASDKWVNDFSFNHRDIIGKTLRELFGTINKEWQEVLKNCLLGIPSDIGVERYLDDDKSEKWLEWSNAPWYDNQENVIGVIIQTKDVTQRVLNEIRLEKLEILLEDKSEIAKIGSWEYNAVKDELYWCNMTKTIHDVPMDHVPNIEKGINFYKEGYSRNTIAMAVDKAMSQGTPWNEKLQLVTAKGREKWVIAAGKPVFKENKFLGLIGTFQDITEVEAIKIKKEEKDRIFKGVFNSSYQFTGILDVRGTFLEINDTALDFANIKAEDVIHKKFWEAYWWPLPEYAKDGLKQLVKAAADGEFIRSEIVVLDKNKEPVPVDFSLKPIYDENNEIVSLLAEGRMIKEMVIAREKLQQSEQKFRALYELSPVAYVLADHETGEILDFNPSFINTSGYSKKDIGKIKYTDLIPSAYMNVYHNSIAELEEKDVFGPVEKEYVKKDGTSYPVLVNKSMLVNKEGRKLIWTSAQDISESKRKEQQIREERKLLRTLIDNLPLNVFIKDRDSKKVLANKSEIEFCNARDESEIIGKTDFDFYDKETAKKSREEDIMVMDSFKPILGKETINIKKDGTLTTFLTSKIPLKGVDGNVNGLVGISLDISDLKQKEEELKRLINVTSLQNKKLINFAHIISHNLRSHTANFSMLLEFLTTEKDEVEKKKIVNMLIDASDNLLETIDNLNEVVAISTNTNLEKKSVRLNEQIATVTLNLAGFLKEHNTKIINEINDDVHIKVIPEYIDNILMNFITNAVKYRKPGKDPLIRLSAKSENGYTVLSIKDNGMGIDLKKHGDKLFGMYKTFHNNANSRGIGLYITKNQIESMNGKIVTTSEVGKGTTFNIYFNEKN